METTQHDPLSLTDPNNKKRRHIPNFIAAKVVCPECIENNNWKNSLKDGFGTGCCVCGENRTVTFGERKFSETNFDYHHVTSNPVEKFVDWIFNELPEGYDTHAFAHNGGRFDFMFICREV